MSDRIADAVVAYLRDLSPDPPTCTTEPSTCAWFDVHRHALWRGGDGRRRLRSRVSVLAKQVMMRTGERITTYRMRRWLLDNTDLFNRHGWALTLIRAYPDSVVERSPCFQLDELTAHEEPMNQTRQQSLLNGMTAVARKIYDSIPSAESWSYKEVCADLTRRGLTVPAYDVLQGAIGKLVECGLVREPQRGMFIRTPVHTPDKSRATGNVPDIEALLEAGEDDAPAPTKDTPAADAAPIASTDPLTVLAELAARLRQTQVQLGTLADEIDHTALAVADRIDSIRKETEKFEQLRRLLADIK